MRHLLWYGRAENTKKKIEFIASGQTHPLYPTYCCTIMDVWEWLELVGDGHHVIATQQLWLGQTWNFACFWNFLSVLAFLGWFGFGKILNQTSNWLEETTCRATKRLRTYQYNMIKNSNCTTIHTNYHVQLCYKFVFLFSCIKIIIKDINFIFNMQLNIFKKVRSIFFKDVH